MDENGGTELTVADVIKTLEDLVYYEVPDEKAYNNIRVGLMMLGEHIVTIEDMLKTALKQRDDAIRERIIDDNVDYYEVVGEHLVEGLEVAMVDSGMFNGNSRHLAGTLVQFLFKLADNQEVSFRAAELLRDLAEEVTLEDDHGNE